MVDHRRLAEGFAQPLTEYSNERLANGWG